MSLNVGLASIG